MRRIVLLVISLAVPMLVIGCGLSPQKPGGIDDSIVLQQLEKSADAADAVAADPSEDLENVFLENASTQAPATQDVRAPSIDLDVALGTTNNGYNDVRNIPSGNDYVATRTGTVRWGGNNVAWVTYRWADGRWEKKAEWLFGGNVVWGRYVRTSAAAVDDSGETRTFSRGLWENGKITRYAVGMHVLNTAENVAHVTGTAYRIRWTLSEPSVIKHVAKVDVDHTITNSGTSITLATTNNLEWFDPGAESYYVAKGTWVATRTFYPQAAGTETYLSAQGSFTPADENTLPADWAHTVLGDKSQTIVRTRHLADGTDRVINLQFSPGGAGNGTIGLYNADGKIRDLATLSWDDRGDGTMIILSDPAVEVTIHVHIPRYLR